MHHLRKEFIKKVFTYYILENQSLIQEMEDELSKQFSDINKESSPSDFNARRDSESDIENEHQR